MVLPLAHLTGTVLVLISCLLLGCPAEETRIPWRETKSPRRVVDGFQFQIKALSSLARLRLLNVLPVRLRRLNPRRLDFILDLELE